jgi:hypothetical protein
MIREIYCWSCANHFYFQPVAQCKKLQKHGEMKMNISSRLQSNCPRSSTVGAVLVRRQRTRQRPLHRELALPQDIMVDYNVMTSLRAKCCHMAGIYIISRHFWIIRDSTIVHFSIPDIMTLWITNGLYKSILGLTEVCPQHRRECSGAQEPRGSLLR